MKFRVLRPRTSPIRILVLLAAAGGVSTIALAIPALVAAEGINLSWDDCGANGTESKTFACNTNIGSNFTLVGSFVPPPSVLSQKL